MQIISRKFDSYSMSNFCRFVLKLSYIQGFKLNKKNKKQAENYMVPFIFARVKYYFSRCISMWSCLLLGNFQQNVVVGKSSMSKKVPFCAPILGPFWPPGDATKIFIENPRKLHYLLWVVVTPCKISDKSDEWSLKILGTDVKKNIFDPFSPLGTQREYS